MGTRGRKSTASLLTGPIQVNRPEPPYSLTDAESDVWRMIVNAMPADHFAPSHFPLLVQLCRHVISSDRVKLLIEQTCGRKQLDCDRLQVQLAMQNSESSAIVRLMRSLRLTPQSVYRAESPKLRPTPGGLAPGIAIPGTAHMTSTRKTKSSPVPTSTRDSLIFKAGSAEDQGGPSLLRMRDVETAGWYIAVIHGNGSWYSLNIPGETAEH